MTVNLCVTTGSVIADILVCVVFLIFAFVAMKKGFVECFFSLVSTALAILLAFLFMKAFVRWTNGLFGLQDVILDACHGAFIKIKGFDIDVSAEGMRALLEEKNFPNFLIQSMVESVGNAEVEAGTTIALLLAQKVSGFAVGLLAWFLLFFLFKLLLLLTRKLLHSVIDKLPIVGAVNHLLGFLVGALQGVFIVSAVVALFAIIPLEGMNAFFNDGVIIGWLYNHNPIHVIVNWIIH